MTIDDGDTGEGSEDIPETKITLVSEADLESATSFHSLPSLSPDPFLSNNFI
jgi:hypothetical protein